MIKYHNKIFAKFFNEHNFIGCRANVSSEYLGIDFTYNKYGHRERDPQYFSDKEYILVGGCSITEGIPINVDDRYTSVLESLSGSPVYNIGLGACGYDAIVRNIINWLYLNKDNKPIHVVTFMPNDTRVILKPKNITSALSTIGTWSKSHEKFVELADMNGYFETNAMLQYRNLKCVLELLNIPYTFIINYTNKVEGHDEYAIKSPLFSEHSVAVDNIHPGEDWHNSMGVALYHHLKSRNIGVN
jgi:hypothetical protein